MSRIREAHHRLREVLRRELRREDEEVRHEDDAMPPMPPEAGEPEIDDLPLGVPPKADREDEAESPGFPHGDPTQG